MPGERDFIIRDCREADLPDITAIYADAVENGTASFELAPPDLAEMASRRATLVGGGYPYLVAEVDGVVAGYAYAGAYRPRPAYGATVEDSIYIRPEMQGRGIGTALLEQLIDAAARQGYRQMVAVIGDRENHGSRALHARLGFVLTGTLRSVGWKHGRWLDCVLMQRSLGEGDKTPR